MSCKVLKNISAWFLLSQSAPWERLVYSRGKPLSPSGLFQFSIWKPYIWNHSIAWCHFMLWFNTQLHRRHLASHLISSSLFSNLHRTLVSVCCQLYSSSNKSFSNSIFILKEHYFPSNQVFRVYIQLDSTNLHNYVVRKKEKMAEIVFLIHGSYYHLSCIFLFPFYRHQNQIS